MRWRRLRLLPMTPQIRLTTGVDQTIFTESYFASITQTTAQTGVISTIPAGLAARSSETTYITDPGYLSRNILGLKVAIDTMLKGKEVAEK